MFYLPLKILFILKLKLCIFHCLVLSHIQSTKVNIFAISSYLKNEMNFYLLSENAIIKFDINVEKQGINKDFTIIPIK